jgi:hypothetical protein
MKTYNDPVFEIFGFSKEYYVDGKLVGSIRLDQPDRELMGYMGRETDLIPESITLDNGVKLRQYKKCTTQLIPLCGKLKNPFVK